MITEAAAPSYSARSKAARGRFAGRLAFLSMVTLTILGPALWSGAADHREVGLQNAVQGLAVAPDGLVVCASGWDDAGREYGLYRDGLAQGACVDTHGPGLTGGAGVALDRDHVYIVLNRRIDADGPTEENGRPTGWTRRCLARRTLQGGHAPFAGGLGPHGDEFALRETPDGMGGEIRGLAADGRGTLYLGDPASARIRVLDTAAMQELRRFTALRVRAMAVEPSGRLWAIQAPDPTLITTDALLPDRDDLEWRAVRFSPKGEPDRTLWMPGAVRPAGIAFDRRGRLYVADAGPAQQVLIYENPARYSKIDGRIGAPGGLSARPRPGLVRASRLPGPTSVGCDAADNIYVGCTRAGAGSALRCYATWRRGGEPELRWEMTGPDALNNPAARRKAAESR